MCGCSPPTKSTTTTSSPPSWGSACRPARTSTATGTGSSRRRWRLAKASATPQSNRRSVSRSPTAVTTLWTGWGCRWLGVVRRRHRAQHALPHAWAFDRADSDSRPRRTDVRRRLPGRGDVSSEIQPERHPNRADSVPKKRFRICQARTSFVPRIPEPLDETYFELATCQKRSSEVRPSRK